jgi:hypothetical protein
MFVSQLPEAKTESARRFFGALFFYSCGRSRIILAALNTPFFLAFMLSKKVTKESQNA